jgi:hypothetical protein
METTSGVLVGAGWNVGGGGLGEAKLLQPQPPGYLKTKILKVKNEKETWRRKLSLFTP